MKWSLHGPDVLAAWVAEMDFDVAPEVRTAILDAVDREDFGYPQADLSDLTAACASYWSEAYGWDVPPARIFAVTDVLAGVAGGFDVFTPAAAPIVLPTPAYPPFFEIIELGGRPVIEVPMTALPDGRPTLDLDAIDDALRAGARGVLLCSPHNPTGRVYERGELVALSGIVERHGARVVADEVHGPLVYPGHHHVPYATVSDAAAGHTVTVTAASKAWNVAGLKCAQVVLSNHDDAVRWRELGVFDVAGSNPLGIAASTAAYQSGRPWLHELVGYLDGNRQRLADLLHEELPDIAYRPPEGTYLAWLDCAGLGLDDPATFFLQHAKVALSDGPPFGAPFASFVRLNFGTSAAMLESIVRAMGEAVRTWA